MAKKAPERKLITILIDCDTERLYGNLATAIAYLQEVMEQHPDRIPMFTKG